MDLDRYAAERRRFARLLGTDGDLGSGLPIGAVSDQRPSPARDDDSDDSTPRSHAPAADDETDDSSDERTRDASESRSYSSTEQ
ncbi:uncharacterized protein Nmag_2261 [Natrialba magadii ATCC 43099]|uniref:Uncharacterized protein n=1 Tax=Natrialba magadii (strain ATCC 43099 / DSM 3394 / CCM 3739 / CIP 104546 / IAM 13178 / JCM 8861 / NBRC 102185 / NCIMB 2190 / MS3) TaxID=547559 RepID=D3SWU4_NATMM|nr:hypothetical protein [Natrialba magadii]ADD05826.1 uncharacterized protein Nmag_2261 [Natrialba magadii ATCC 43099]ELY30098.1 hypothetical protein C500_09099 [Natrialba magadii ATCC 43099]